MDFFEQRLDQSEIESLPIDPIQLYETCSYKEGYAYLRGIQEEVLRSWHEKRSQKDVICKMNTGSGKTLTGLLMLYSKLVEHENPVLYTCPDKQLVGQTLKLAALYGIPVCEFAENSRDFPSDFLNSKKILVCTFQRLFNGKSIFNKEHIKLGAVLLDDAHKCVDIARQQSSVELSRSHPIAERLFKLFESSLEYQLPGSFIRLKQNDPTMFMKVPYWTWLDNQKNIIEIITDHISKNPDEKLDDNDSLVFKWNFMTDNLPSYDCYIGGNTIEINPIHVPYHNIASFAEAEHRFILSATFEDDYDLIKDLGISYESIINPIIPKDRKHIGKRLILSPSRYDTALTNEELQTFIKGYSIEGYNVVVLVPSTEKTKKWIDVGATYVDKDNINETIVKLNSSVGNFVVFNNRYDGLDLYGDQCRVLVIDGLPTYISLQEQFNETILTRLSNGRRAQFIEQGLGRGVRSAGDFCVTYLLGKDLMGFVSQKSNLNHFTPVTRIQLQSGLEMLDKAKSKSSLATIKEIASLCLTESEGWIKYHNQILKQAALEDVNDIKQKFLEIAKKESEALSEFRKRRYKQASDMILSIVDNMNLTEKEKAWYYQYAAHLLYSLDRHSSNNLQSKASNMTTHMFHPIDGHVYKKIHQNNEKQSSVILRALQELERSQDIVIKANTIIDALQYNPEKKSKNFERQLALLGDFLGFKSQLVELESGNGPDVLWSLTNGQHLLLEAKSRAKKELISRGDVEQLLHSEQWFKNMNTGNNSYLTVTLQRSHTKDKNVNINDNMRVLDLESLESLHKNLSQFAGTLQLKNGNCTESEISDLLDAHKFTPVAFIKTYLKQIK